MKTYNSSRYSNHGSGHYYKKPFRKTRGFYILLILILAISGFIYWSIKKTDQPAVETEPKFTDQESAPSLEASVAYTDGSVKFQKANGVWSDLLPETKLQAQDSIKTESSAKAIIELPDKSLIRLAANSQITLAQIGMADIVIEQNHGTAFHRVNDNSPAIYRVKNGNLELTALGTAFNVNVSTSNIRVTVTESKVKAKIYNGEDIVNMRTLEQGTEAIIDTKKELKDMITSQELTSNDLLENDWYAWNFDQDLAKNFFLGIFSKAVKLVILEPAKLEVETSENKIKIKGATEPEAQIYALGKELENKEGNFETELLLASGETKIEITVVNGKNKNSKTITVNSKYKKGSIDLAGELKGGKANLTWAFDNLEGYNKFLVMMSTGSNPSYPTSPYHTLASVDKKDSWDNLSNGSHRFQVCALTTDNNCLALSNILELTTKDSSTVEASTEITLTAVSTDTNTINLSWTINEQAVTTDGFKSIISQVPEPKYPGNSFHSLTTGQRNDSWKNVAPGTYYFRVCLIKNGSCLKYSNEQRIDINQLALGSILLTGQSSNGKVYLSWETNNLVIQKGFKVIMSEAANVIFPGKAHHLVIENNATTDTWNDLEPDKTYYFRVCQSAGSTCGAYSNEFSIATK